MNICPNCFEELEESRLLYELYFYEGYGLSTIMDKVAGGSDIVKVIAKERDDILYERYLDETIHYHIGRDDGYTIEAFREMICTSGRITWRQGSGPRNIWQAHPGKMQSRN